MASSNPYNLNSGMKCIKYMLLIINFMFLLTSVLLILVGTTIQTVFGDFKEFIDDYFFSPPTLLVAVGCILMIVATFGCFGALRESTLLINIYGLLLLLIFVLEIGAAIAAFALEGKIKAMLMRTMNDSIYMYKTNNNVAAAVDFMQEGLQCCGVSGIEDWENILESNQNDTTVPVSCCPDYKTGSESCEFPYMNGCYPRMVYIIYQSAMLIATGASTVAFVQLLGVVCAFMLAKTIRRTKSLREARRWQLQQSLGIVANGGKNIYDTNYTQLEKSEIAVEPVTYTSKSPSVN